MKVTETKLPGVVILKTDVYPDERGYFQETWNEEKYGKLRLGGPFVQDNISFSQKSVLRGLHFQNPQGQGKLVHVLSGEVFDVAVDIRVGSPSFGQWVGVELSQSNHKQLYVPRGFAHGFCVLSNDAIFSYKCTDFYNASTEMGIIWNDPEIGIDWPIDNPVLSDKDAKLPKLSDIDKKELPGFEVV